MGFEIHEATFEQDGWDQVPCDAIFLTWPSEEATFRRRIEAIRAAYVLCDVSIAVLCGPKDERAARASLGYGASLIVSDLPGETDTLAQTLTDLCYRGEVVPSEVPYADCFVQATCSIIETMAGEEVHRTAWFFKKVHALLGTSRGL